MTTRRGFLATLAASALVPRLGWADAGSPAYLAAAKAGEDYVLHGLSETAQSLFRVALPARGHAACAHPQRPEAVAFARRPGTYALVIDCVRGGVLARLAPPDGRQFNGHGVFSADGALLMTSEVVAEGSAGRVGLWAADEGYRRVGEWNTGGIGPHDIRRLSDGRLVVANGGIETDPQDRRKLNLGRMRPNIAVLSPEGRLNGVTELAPDLSRASIRHLSVTADDRVVFAMQWEGDAAEIVPLTGLWQPDQPAVLHPIDAATALAMQGYAGSVAWNADGSALAVTSPRGGTALVIGADGALRATLRRADLCGVAAAGRDFLLTGGSGGLWGTAGDALAAMGHAAASWDNHLIRIG